MNIKYFTIIAFVIIFLVVIWRSFNEIKEEKKTESNLVKIEAVVKNARRSGVRAQLSTLLTVSYSFDGVDYTATLKRGGYAEGNYNPDDTIYIYIDPEKPNTPVR